MSLLTLERNSPSPQDSDAEETLSSSSHEGFVAREHYVTSLPPRPWASLGRHGGEQLRIFTHLKKVLRLLRASDTIKLAVELENSSPRKVTKYLVLVATTGYQDTEEAIVLGTEQEDSTIRLGLVLPLWTDTEIKLDGDGGFSVHSGDRQAVFKPSSVQSMWTTLQTLYQATENARQHNYYVGGLSHTWMIYYQSHCTEDYIVRNEWNLTKDVESFRPDSPLYTSQITTQAGNKFEKLLVSKLREVMLHEDLEEVTSRQLRLKLEEETGMELRDYREFLDRHMLRILGQMEQPSKILDYLYLGSEWNASNLSELKELGVGYILNITREIDNFYPEVFKYLNIRLYDVPDSELIKHWDKSYRFIKEAKVVGKKVLVHCKMGISRSAATVLAYMMKEYRMTLVEAKRHVKGIRSCINPNEGFVTQLKAYEGILTARHNPCWGRQAPSRLSHLRMNRSMSDPDLLQSIEKETLEREDLEREKMEQIEELGQELEEKWGKDDQHRLHFEHTRPIHNVASVANIPSLIHQQHAEEPELTFPPVEEEEEEEEEENEESGQENQTEAIASPSYLHKETPLVHSTPVDKSRNIRNFLASLPPLPHGGSNDDGIGENIPTSNSGSGYSTPIYTPPDEEQIHLHMSSQENAPDLQNKEVQQSPQSCATTEEVCDGEPEQQSSSPGGKLGSTRIPPKPAPPPMMTKSSPSPSSVTSSVCQQHPLLSAALLVSRSQRSNSLPHTLGGFASKESKKTSNISPTSSKTSLSSLARCSPAVLEEEVEEEEGRTEGSPRGETASPLVRGGGEKVRVLLEQPSETREMDSQSESHMELTSPLERERIMLHRRAKSDTHDISGPIKTAQISSVPERVKEIEERNLQVPSAQQQVASTDQVDAHVDSASVNDKHSSNISHSSSEESLPPLQGAASGEADKPTSPKHSSLQDTHTRHASLSPKPPSTRALLQHMPAQTSVSLPASVSPPEYDSGSPHALSEEELASSLHGAVKAKIQDIEGKTSHKVVQRTQQESLQQRVEAVVRRTSVSTAKRPSSEIMFHNPYIGMVEVNSPSSSKNQVPVLGPKKAETPKTRRKGSICNDLFTGRGRTDGVPNEALYNAWAAILPNEHLPIDLSSVLELKQRFEVTESPRERRKTPSNLRRSNSLRDTRLLSPPRRLGAPGQGKQYSSNASLLLLGRNGSQQGSLSPASLSNTPAERNMRNSSPSKSPVTS